MASLDKAGLTYLWGKLKAKLNNKSDVGHSHSYTELSNKPTIPTVPSSLPANGGNADTVDNYHIRTGTSGAAGYITFVV